MILDFRKEMKSILQKKHKEPWQIEVQKFIEEWFNSKDFITVKTSGSTGISKKLLIKKELFIASAKATIAYFSLEIGSSALLCLSPNYIAGKIMVVRAIIGKWVLHIQKPTTQLNLPKVPIDFAALVPMQLESFFKQKVQITKVIIGGAPLLESQRSEIKEYTKNNETQFFMSFGMSETVSHIALQDLSKDNAPYTALPGVSFNIDKRGCLIINAPHLQEKPFTSNDLVRLMDSQSFEWLGRIDFMINSGGIKFFPERLETQWQLWLPKNQACMIGALPHPQLGEQIILIVEENGLSIPEIEMLAQKKCTTYEKPMKIYRLPKLHYTKNNKIDRRATLAQIISNYR